MLIKEEDGSKSAYLAHIGGFFAFVGFAGLSLIFWIIYFQCWSKKSCCLKEYHNPQNIRTFWWLCFIFLCGVLACCISGIIVTINFGKKVGSTKCLYERIYYDSEYGELKNGTKWVGFNHKIDFITELKSFVNKDRSFSKDYFFGDWEKINLGCSLADNYYPKGFKEEIVKVTDKCRNTDRKILKEDDATQLICDPDDLCNSESIYYEYISEASRITKYFSDEVEKMDEFNKKNDQRGFIIQINQIDDKLKNISQDLNNYKENFLEEVHYYTNIAKIFGYILVIIYYSIVIVIVALSCFLLWAYSYFKEQRVIYTFMHIAWNLLKFFSFSFFMFGAAFGALYLCSRDLIGYNQYLFTTNLEEKANTTLLPNKTSKEFLGYCMNNQLDNNYINNINFSLITNFISQFYNNLNAEKYIIENYNFSNLQQSYLGFTSYRLLEEEDTTDGFRIVNISFIEAGVILNSSIKTLYNKLNGMRIRRRRYLDSQEYVNDIIKLKATIDTLNCGYLKNELQILYDSLYELSIESRISCALCCCIGFFIEVSVSFYLLVIYHYNNNEFKEGYENQTKLENRQPRKFDMESQNEFMDKSKPKYIQNKNKKLDLEFSWN